MPDFQLRLMRRARGSRRRGLSGLGLVLVVLGLFALVIGFATLPRWVLGLWPLVIVAIGAFNLLRRPGWVDELDLRYGPGAVRGVERPRRIVSVVLIAAGIFILPFTTGVLDARLIGPLVLIALGLLLVWRRAR
jgi:hypothetical protein